MKNKIFFLILILFAVNTAVYAQDFTLKFDPDKQTVEISGFVGKENLNSNVTISVLQTGKDITAAEEVKKENVREYIQYATQISVGEDGGYFNTLKINSDVSGKYKVRVRYSENNDILTKEFNFLSKADAESVIEKINSVDRTANDAVEKAEEIIKNDNIMLLLENTAFTDLENISLASVYQNLLKTEKYTSVSEILDNIITQSVVLAYNSSAKNCEKYTQYFNANAEIYKIYQDLNNKDSVINALKGRNYADMKSLCEDFEQNTLLQDICTADTWSKMKSLLLNYSEKYKTYTMFRNIDTADFKALSENKQYTVMKYISDNRNKMTDIDIFTSEINKKIKEVKTEPNSGGSGGGGSSNGSSGNSSKGSAGIGNISITNNNPEKKTFTDLESVLWAKDSIMALYEAGVVSGRSETTFDPSAGVTREEFVKMIVSAFGLESDGNDCTFADADKTKWYYTYLAVAEMHGVIYGDENGNFGVGRGITREDMSVMLYRILGDTEPVKEKVVFSDNDEISEYALNAVEVLQCGGIISGMEDGSFAPKKGATRAEAARMIYTIMKKTGKF